MVDLLMVDLLNVPGLSPTNAATIQSGLKAKRETKYCEIFPYKWEEITL